MGSFYPGIQLQYFLEQMVKVCENKIFSRYDSTRNLVKYIEVFSEDGMTSFQEIDDLAEDIVDQLVYRGPVKGGLNDLLSGLVQDYDLREFLLTSTNYPADLVDLIVNLLERQIDTEEALRWKS